MQNFADETLALAQQLIALPSVSPDDGGCQAVIATYLANLGFHVEHLRYGDVDNLWAVHGHEGPLLVFAGHTDVVPTGPIDAWQTPPFEPIVSDGLLFGRGAADMKGALAAMLTATRRFLGQHPVPAGRLGLLITSDEEAAAINGTRKVMEYLDARGEVIDWCVVGEPSSDQVLGDVIRIGRRGSLNARLIILGIQGHVAYPQDARNPIHLAMPALTELISTVWDEGNAHFPATSLQISNIHAGTGANNVIPGTLELQLNFRFSTESTSDSLQQRCETILKRHQVPFDMAWSLSGNPFLTSRTTLIDAVQRALIGVVGKPAQLSTGGGTSDGRFIAPTGAEVVELGPRNDTIHKVNECVAIDDLTRLSEVYTVIMQALLGPGPMKPTAR